MYFAPGPQIFEDGPDVNPHLLKVVDLLILIVKAKTKPRKKLRKLESCTICHVSCHVVARKSSLHNVMYGADTIQI
jgi:hypothetical protein